MNWKSMLFDETPEPPKEEEVPVTTTRKGSGIPGIPASATSQSSAPVAKPSAQPITVQTDEAVSSSIMEKLRGKYATSPYAAILEGFQSTMDSLAEAIPEEGNRFRAALKA